MFSKTKQHTEIDAEQLELYRHAKLRIKQKKRLNLHFVIFLVGCVFLIILNEVLGYGKDFTPFKTPWFVWAILIWGFIFLVHAINVLFSQRFMGKEWEEKQLGKLVAKQKARIDKLQKKVDEEYPLPKTTDAGIKKNDINE